MRRKRRRRPSLLHVMQVSGEVDEVKLKYLQATRTIL